MLSSQFARLILTVCFTVSLEIHKLQKNQIRQLDMSPGTKKSDHITDVLHDFHWLCFQQRIHFKMLRFTFKVLHGLAPHYLDE